VYSNFSYLQHLLNLLAVCPLFHIRQKLFGKGNWEPFRTFDPCGIALNRSQSKQANWGRSFCEGVVNNISHPTSLLQCDLTLLVIGRKVKFLAFRQLYN
jgi:hypothetical protein